MQIEIYHAVKKVSLTMGGSKKRGGKVDKLFQKPVIEKVEMKRSSL